VPLWAGVAVLIRGGPSLSRRFQIVDEPVEALVHLPVEDWPPYVPMWAGQLVGSGRGPFAKEEGSFFFTQGGPEEDQLASVPAETLHPQVLGLVLQFGDPGP
jgi:hypothetical protein